MIEYRSFCNPDLPQILRLWQECELGRGAALDFTCDALEILVFSKLTFVPKGLIVALDGPRIVGFAHAGFENLADGSGLNQNAGVLFAVMVHPDYRRQGIGRELIRHAEAYLINAKVNSIQAGGSPQTDSFYFALYGGSEFTGFLLSDPNADPFWQAIGYVPSSRWAVLQRDLRDKPDIRDFRIVNLRRSMQLGLTNYPEEMTRAWGSRYGNIDSLRFLLLPKNSEEAVAEVACYGLDLFDRRWNERAVGMSDLFVEFADRRKCYAKTLMLEVLRRLREETFTCAELHVEESNTPALNLVQSLGFVQVDTGIVYMREALPS